MNKIFKKKKSFKYIYLLSLISLILIFLYFTTNSFNKNFFILNEVEESFFIIPDEKGGKKINNLDKKVLHLNLDEKPSLTNKNNFSLKFSIQISASDDYQNIKTLISEIEKNVDKNDLYVVIFDHNLGKEYLLLYKNFDNQDVAMEYCLNYLKIVNKCIIINAQNFT